MCSNAYVITPLSHHRICVICATCEYCKNSLLVGNNVEPREDGECRCEKVVKSGRLKREREREKSNCEIQRFPEQRGSSIMSLYTPDFEYARHGCDGGGGVPLDSDDRRRLTACVYTLLIPWMTFPTLLYFFIHSSYLYIRGVRCNGDGIRL